ncbi:hypothetical protein GQ53DRAFT_674556 [Thozetella sp. PMI_491]|nr:hypothetical protein GQ53DRAFT_674556 [Thozetella sp. PMI_491]
MKKATQAQLHSEQIQELRDEVAQLREVLAKAGSGGDNNRSRDTAPIRDPVPDHGVQEDHGRGDIAKAELSNPTERSPRGYYGHHCLFRFFSEIPQLFPSIKEIYDESVKPLGFQFRKNKLARKDWKSAASVPDYGHLDALLPSRAECDALVSFYIDHFEHVHRILHIPTFRRAYSLFWTSGHTHHPATTVLILAIMSISGASAGASDPTYFSLRSQNKPTQWISACDVWLRTSSLKYRNLVHYQVSCLVYIAKRMHMIDKKNFWSETGALVQSAMIDDLQRDPSPELDSPYTIEMKRRIWTTIRELALQNSFEYGLPSLLHSIDSDVLPPANIDDESFDQISAELPAAKSSNHYTSTSYQCASSSSWALRLEISRRLFSRGLTKATGYEDALQYTHRITQAIDLLPSWDADENGIEAPPKARQLAHVFLRFQLMECILALHRPYLKGSGARFRLSENIVYQTSLDILHLNLKLGALGIQSPVLIREDLLLASLNLAHITMLHPRESTTIIMTNSGTTLDLLHQCLPFMEDVYLRLVHSKPWCLMTMCAIVMILEIYLGKETRPVAKALYSQLLLGVCRKQVERQNISALDSQNPTSQDPGVQVQTLASGLPTSTGDIDTLLPDSWGPYLNDFDFCINPFELDV